MTENTDPREEKKVVTEETSTPTPEKVTETETKTETTVTEPAE